MKLYAYFMKKIWTALFNKKRENSLADQNAGSNSGRRLQEEMLFHNLERLMNTRNVYLKHELSRKDLTNALRTNECYLARAIRRFTGKTINEYINSYRLEHAARLLLTGREEVTVETIAYESGFSSLRHFYRLFHFRYKVSPARYRRMYEERALA